MYRTPKEKEKCIMRKRYVLIIMLFVFTTLLFCTPVSLDQARRVAQNITVEKSGQSRGLAESGWLSNDAQSHIYLINLMPEGYVLVSGDDAAQPVLGYNFDTKWNDATVPIQLKSMLKNWQEQLAYIITNRLAADAEIRSQWQRLDVVADRFVPQISTRDVAPLLTSTWGQQGYYNDLCPSGTPVGCVATAMSQIMRYWAYPATGSGTHSYVHPVYGTQSADFGATTYNWAAMPNAVGSANISVATLCYHAGVAVDMDYDPTGSGAYSFDVPPALINYFRYKNTAVLRYKSAYADATWHSMMQGELNSRRPIYYAGSGPEGGHAFVLDGWQGTNYYHVNWGWDGYYNGYYYLTALNPGGSSFTNNQEAVIGIQPNEVSLTLLEDFESADWPPNGWQTTTWTQSNSSPIAGTYSARYYTGGQSSGAQLITPKLAVDGTSAPITYKAKCGTTSRSEHIYTRYSTNGSTWTTLHDATLTSAAQTFTVPVTGLAAGSYYFCFETYSTNTQATGKTYILDDVTGPILATTAAVNLTTWNAGNVAPGESASSGLIFQLSNVGSGILTISSVTDLSASEFKSTINPAVQLVYGQVHEFSFTYDPLNYGTDNQAFQIVTNGGTLTINLTGSAVAYRFGDGFETYPDFALTFAPWTQYDGDGRPTYGVTDVEFTNSGYTGSYIIFNASQCVPDMSGTAMDTYSGYKGAYCFDAIPTPINNDWLITPAIPITGPTASVSFWAKSYTDTYGLERFKVRLSTTTNDPLTAFTTYLAGGASTYVQAPVDWTQYTYSLNAYAGQTVYIAIQCVSSDAFIFMVDNFSVYDSGYSPPVPSFGHVSGYVYEYGTTNPIVNAKIQIGTKVAYSNASGFYQINNLVVGTYQATCTTPGADYFGTTVPGIVITENNTTTQNIYLKWAELAASPSSIDVSLYSLETANRTLTISNPGGTDTLAVALYITETTPAARSQSNFIRPERVATPDRSYRVTPSADVTLDRNPAWMGYASIEDVAWYSYALSERGTYFWLEDFGLYNEAGLTVSKIRHWFYDLDGNNWGGNNTFNIKIYDATGTTLLFTSPTPITANAYPTVTEYTLPTPMTFHESFLVMIVPVDQVDGMPYSLGTDPNWGSSYYWDTTIPGWVQMSVDLCIDVYADGGKWLAFDAYPDQLNIYGEVGPAGSSNFNLHFDTNNVSLGTRTANIYIYNNSTYIAPSGRGDVMIIPVSMTVSAPPAVGDISGYVKEINTNTPLSGATITIGSRNTTSDEFGYYEMLDVVTGNYTLSCSLDRYPTKNLNIEILENQTLTQDVYMDWARMEPAQTTFDISQQTNTIMSYPVSVSNTGTIDLAWDAASGIWGGDVVPSGNLNQDWEAGSFAGWSGWIGPQTDIYYGYGYEGSTGSTFVFASEGCLDYQWLITPKLHPVSGNNTLSFYLMDFNDSAETLEMWVSTTTTDTTSFSYVSTLGPLGDDLWHNQNFSLAAYNDTDIYVAFKYTRINTQYSYMFVDNITGPTHYMPPVGWLSTPVNTGSITAGGGTSIGLQVNTTGLPVGTYTAQTWIFSDDTVEEYDQLYVTLTVLNAPPETPQNIAISRPDASTDLLLSWDASDNALGYHVYFRDVADTTFSGFTLLRSVTTNSAVVTQAELAAAGLTGNTCFFRVTADNEAVVRHTVSRVSRSPVRQSYSNVDRIRPVGYTAPNKLLKR